MKPEHRQHAAAIDLVSKAISEWTTDLHFDRDPSMTERYGPDGRRLWAAEARSRLQHLAEALAADRSALFVQNALWSQAAFIAREIGDGDLRLSLACMRETVAAELPAPVANRALVAIDEAIATLDATQGKPDVCLPPSCIAPDQPNGQLARVYLLHLLQRNQQEAANTIFEAAREGRSLPELYETVIRPALTEVGRMWHLQEASVADEHYCTAATQMIMAQLRSSMPRRPSNGHRMLAMAVGGELHDLGIRMVADLFEMEGWEAEYLGANMPASELPSILVDEDGRLGFDLLALSGTTTLAVRPTADLIDTIRAHPVASAVRVLVGGGPFRQVPDLWRIVGADGYAPDGASALGVAADLVRAAPLRS